MAGRVLQGSYRGRWALQLGVPQPAPSDTANADDIAVLDLGPIQDLLGALYDSCPCAQLRGRMLSCSPAELFLVLFYAYNSASGGGPFGIRLTARQLQGLFSWSGCRVLLEFRRAGAAAAVELAAHLDDQERMDAMVMATTRIVAGMRAVGVPPDDQWILKDAECAGLGDDEILGSLT